MSSPLTTSVMRTCWPHENGRPSVEGAGLVAERGANPSRSCARGNGGAIGTIIISEIGPFA